ncbi:hypothetical protein L3X38_032713 [Prunus dulcis]|uniref:DUF4219 domain-containing protein n=1 Tax=Prunus dulcis TaxID=3755 RepID=A0AAD4VGR4_PRUDU|nr:hypothetical protein L3X38_032713 [Prunus dulcis]
MSGSGGSEVRTPIFSGENYKFWMIKMVTIFKSPGLWSLVEKGFPTPDSKKTKKAEESPEEEADAEMIAVLMKDAKALGIIQNAISDQIFPQIGNADSAKMAWNLLCSEYHGGDQEVIAILKSQEQRFDMHNMDTAEKAFGSFSVNTQGQNRIVLKLVLLSLRKIGSLTTNHGSLDLSHNKLVLHKTQMDHNICITME